MTTTKESYDQGVYAERQRCIKIVHEWLNGQIMLLRAGEMSLQEKRTALAIVAAISVAIHDGKKE